MSVVLTFIVLLALIMMPRLTNRREATERRAFPARIRDLVLEARNDAISNGQAVTLEYDDNEGEFFVTTQDAEGEESEGGRVRMPEEITVGRLELDGGDSTAGEWLVTFYPDGTSDTAGIQFENGDSFSLTIDERGIPALDKGVLKDPSEVRWEAGELEQRA